MPRWLPILAVGVASILSLLIAVDIVLPGAMDEQIVVEKVSPTESIDGQWCLRYEVRNLVADSCKFVGEYGSELRNCFDAAKIGAPLPDCWR